LELRKSPAFPPGIPPDPSEGIFWFLEGLAKLPHDRTAASD